MCAAFAREYCSRGVSVQYEEYEHLIYAAQPRGYLKPRPGSPRVPWTAGTAELSNIAPGNSLVLIG